MSKTGLSLVIAVVTVLCAAAFGIFADIVQPSLAANALNGGRLAQQWCSACHVVNVNQQQANADAPPFEEIAGGQISANGASRHFCLIRTPKCRT